MSLSDERVEQLLCRTALALLDQRGRARRGACAHERAADEAHGGALGCGGASARLSKVRRVYDSPAATRRHRVWSDRGHARATAPPSAKPQPQPRATSAAATPYVPPVLNPASADSTLLSSLGKGMATLRLCGEPGREKSRRPAGKSSIPTRCLSTPTVLYCSLATRTSATARSALALRPCAWRSSGEAVRRGAPRRTLDCWPEPGSARGHSDAIAAPCARTRRGQESASQRAYHADVITFASRTCHVTTSLLCALRCSAWRCAVSLGHTQATTPGAVQPRADAAPAPQPPRLLRLSSVRPAGILAVQCCCWRTCWSLLGLMISSLPPLCAWSPASAWASLETTGAARARSCAA